LLCDHQRRVVRQHDTACADPNAVRFLSHMADHNRRCRARDAGKIMMFGQPETMVAPSFGMLREVDGIPERQRSVPALDDRGQIEHGKTHCLM
jgi:hypothetical protein